MSTSRIPAVLDALVTALTTALPAVSVVDGPPTNTIPNKALFIGATAGDVGIEFEQEWRGQGAMRRRERFDIPNLLHLQTGNPETKAARDEVFAFLATVENTLRADPTLGISGYTARVQFGTSGEYSQTRTGKGLTCRVSFTITAETVI